MIFATCFKLQLICSVLAGHLTISSGLLSESILTSLQCHRYFGESRTSFSLRSTVMLGFHSLTLVWLRFSSHMGYVSFRSCCSFQKFLLSNRFDHKAPLCCGLQSRILSCWCYMDVTKYTMQFFHRIVGSGLLLSVDWWAWSIAVPESDGSLVWGRTSFMSQ